MTRQEQSGERSLDFSRWIRENLPDSSSGFCVGNQDWLFWNWKTRQLLLAEEKTRNGKLATWMRTFIKTVMHPALSRYCKDANIDYRGYNLIEFSGTDPTNGTISINKIEVSAEEFKQILSFEIYPPFYGPND